VVSSEMHATLTLAPGADLSDGESSAVIDAALHE
jgi:hypothetical protein